MNTKLLPHFLIVGAPKCGTTALHHYLSQHPQLNLSPKEIHFFGKDLGYKVERPSLKEYQSYFKSEGLNGDGSVWYLYSDSIYQELKELGIQPKIIVMLRNPVEVAYALHSQNIIDANENELDFEKALALEEDRKKGIHLPPNVDPPRTVFYKETADFYPRIKMLLDHIPRESIFFGLQEDLKSDTLGFLYRIENFLKIDHFTSYNLEKINENKVVKNPKIHNLIKKPGNLKVKLFRTLIPSKKIRKKLVDKIYNANLEKNKRKELSGNLKSDLEQYFKPNIEKLGEITGIQIAHWID